MTKGVSLHVGLNSVDPRHYGWPGTLNACEADAEDMQQLASEQGYRTSILRTKQATRAAVIKGVTSAAQALEAGDIFVLTYSGHGGQVPDRTGEEIDGLDETWCHRRRLGSTFPILWKRRVGWATCVRLGGESTEMTSILRLVLATSPSASTFDLLWRSAARRQGSCGGGYSGCRRG